MFNVIQFLQDNEIDFQQGQTFVNTSCAFCGDQKQHLGWHLTKEYTTCWKCGYHRLSDSIQETLGIEHSTVKQILKQYESTYVPDREIVREKLIQSIEVPGDKLLAMHKNYLVKRNFDPDYIERKYFIKGAGPTCLFNGIDFRYRIIIPVLNKQGKTISFQGRDVSGKSKIRYLGCPEEYTVQNYKDTLYNLNNCTKNTIVLVEGVFDTWRMGDGFCCSFGTSLKTEQIRELAGFDHIKIMFDPEVLAQKKAMGYAQQLASLGRSVDNVCLNLEGKDPGDLTPREAIQIKTLLGMI